MQYNDSQREAIDLIHGPGLVISCPGSGKTSIIIERVHKMITEKIENILVITFTTKAANQMAERYRSKYGVLPAAALFGTIHSLCFRVIRKAYGYTKDSFIDEWKAKEFIKQKIEGRVAAAEREKKANEILNEISYFASIGIPLEEYIPQDCNHEIFQEVYLAYQSYKKQNRKVDYNDMITLCCECFRNNQVELQYWQKRFSYIMVDEFQDVSSLQAEIIYHLAGEAANLLVVGDDDQSIYSFRGCSRNIMLDFCNQFPQAQVIHMNINYRSAENIIQRASQVIKNNQNRFHKDIICSHKGKFSNCVSLFKSKSAVDEAKQVVNAIKVFSQENKKYSDIAVLYRNNYQNMYVAKLLYKEGIPFRTSENIKNIYTEFIFADIAAYYRLAENNAKKWDLSRILNHPNRYLPAKEFEACTSVVDVSKRAEQIRAYNQYGKEQAQERIYDMIYLIKSLHGATPTKFLKILKSGGYYKWLKVYAEFLKKNVSEFYEVFTALEEEVSSFLTMEEWINHAEQYSKAIGIVTEEKEAIYLSTLHSAKGLEFDTVFMIGIKKPRVYDDEELEEERRLFYVGMTRAINRLILYADEKDSSPFLTEMQR